MSIKSMNAQKTDRRIKYTRMILSQTLVGLLKAKPVEKISITELCKLSDINRATFYLHYNSVYELLFEIQDTFYKSIKTDIERLIQNGSNQSTLLLLMRKIEDQKELCEALFLSKAEKPFQEKLISIAKDEMTRAWTKTYSIKNKGTLRLVTEFIIAGSVGLIQDWIGNGCKESPEEIALLLEKLCESTLSGGLLR